MKKNILKIKYYGRKALPVMKYRDEPVSPKFSFIIDKRLEDIFKALNIKTMSSTSYMPKKQPKLSSDKYIVIRQDMQNIESRINEFDNDTISVDLEDYEISIIDNEMKKDKIKRAHDDKEFEKSTRELEIEL